MKWWHRVVDYQAKVGEAANTAMVAKGIRERRMPLDVEIVLYNQGIDLDNAWKATLDGMEGVTCLKDSQVWHQEATMATPDQKGPRIQVTVRWGR